MIAIPTGLPAGIELTNEQKHQAIRSHFQHEANVVTKWRLREVSLAPLVMDETAKLRAAAV